MTAAGDLDSRTAVRRALSAALVTALCVAAFTAIIAILSGDFDDTDVRVIGSSIGFAAFSATAASGASLRFRASERLRSLGLVTIALSLAAFALLLAAIWSDGELETWRWFGSMAIAALVCSHASLVSGSLRPTDGWAVEWLVIASIALAMVDGLFGVLAVSGAVDEVDEAFVRLLAVLMVLLVLTTVLPPILRRVQPWTAPAGAPAAGPGAPGALPSERMGAPGAGKPPLPFAAEVLAAADRIESLNAEPGNRAPQIRRECERLRQLARLYER